jgi:DNA-binding CsgD family transcriptional regulator
MLWGRADEQARLDALLAAARSGASGALVLRGEPGIGKSALLDYAAERAEGMRVLRGAGIESEAELPFAGLHLLLRPVVGRLDALPAPQHRALAGAFGLGSETGGDRFMIGAAVLSLLSDAAEREPLLCLVDDAQWLDGASAEALLFAARRLDREGVVIVFAVRDYAGALDAAGIPELTLRGLDAERAAAMLAGSGLSAELRDRLIAETRGNPLALRELPAVAEGAQLGPLPLTSRVLDAFHHQVRSLPDATRTLLLIAAADDTGELPTLLRAAGALGLGIADLQPAEASGLISFDGGTLAFRHPLIRAAVYHSAPLTQRIAAHEVLAEAHDGDRRAWHRAAAATGPDERVAAELERAAGRAIERSGYAAAAAAYERAAQLSEDPDASLRRITTACEAAVRGGRLEWAMARAERADRDVTDPLIRARLIEVRATADFARGDLRRAHRLLTEGVSLVGASDPGRAVWMLLEALHAAWVSPTDRELIAATVDQFATLDLDDAHTAVAWLVRWGTAMIMERDTTGFPPLSDVLPAARATGAAAGPRGMLHLAGRAFVAGRDEDAADIAAEFAAASRSTGMIFTLPAELGFLTITQTFLGRHHDALISGTECLRIGRDTGQPLWISWASGVLAMLAAVEGNEERCRRLCADAELDGDAPRGSLAGITWARFALGLLDLGNGRIQDAFDRLHAIVTGSPRHQTAVARCVPDLVEAAVRLGRPKDAAPGVELLTAWARTVRQPWIDALLARCHALTAPDAAAEAHYQRALSLHEAKSRPFERARTELLYGEWLRRAKRKAEARVQLGAALRVFEELGSVPWAERARTELSASGASVPRAAAPAAFADLTPQELQITQLAAHGLSNRHIAAQLFLSPKTVAYHLYKAYPKLGIASRAELAALT